MAATAPTEVFRPAGNTCCSDQPPASNDVESCSAPLRGLAIRCQKRAVLFPRRHGLPTCENCAWGALGGRQQRARFAHPGVRTASQCKVSRAYRGHREGGEPAYTQSFGKSCNGVRFAKTARGGGGTSSRGIPAECGYARRDPRLCCAPPPSPTVRVFGCPSPLRSRSSGRSSRSE